MRLWHYKLIPVLPKEMLVSQWRECIAIKRQWEKGTLKHRLVSYVMDHSKNMFYQYVERVFHEMDKRGIKYKKEYIQELVKFVKDDEWIGLAFSVVYPEHNDEYLKICYWNLYEKHIRGIISDEEWKPIEELYEGVMICRDYI